jgi:hypothetical protein
VSVIKPVTTKTLIESKQEIDKSELKKDFLEFVAYLKKMAIIHDEDCHFVKHKKTGDPGMKKIGSRSSGHNSEGISYGGAGNKASDCDRTKSGHGRSSDSTSTGKQSAREPPPCLNTKECAGEAICPTVLTPEMTMIFIVLLSEYKNKKDADKKKTKLQNFRQQRSDGGQQRRPDRVSHG